MSIYATVTELVSHNDADRASMSTRVTVVTNSTGNDFEQNMWTVTIDAPGWKCQKRFTDEQLVAGAALTWVNYVTGEDMTELTVVPE